METPNLKSEVIRFKLTPELRKKIEAAAKENGLSMSAWMTYQITQALKK